MIGRIVAAITRPSAAVASVCALVVGLAGAAFYARALDGVYPIRLWLFWPLLMIWGWAALFNAACASFGQLVLVRVLRMRELPALESAVLSMAVGVVAFVFAMYAGGACALYGRAFALALPLCMLAAGARDGALLLRRLVADVALPTRREPLAIAISVFGALCVFVLYLQVMTPDSLNYDATWYHLTVAQDYARAGKIVAFPADYNKNFPQLNALINTWVWTLPGMDLPLRCMLALHDEFALFLWTLAGVAAGVRFLVDDFTLRGSWVSFFLFPIIFVYDDNMGASADHIAGFFSLPVMLVALRSYSGSSSFAPRQCALFAIVCAGGMLTKYQAVYIIVPACAVIGAVWLRRCLEHCVPALAPDGPRVLLRDLLRAPLIMLGVGLLLFSPHLIRNLVFYKNPVYPLMREVFPSTPDVPRSAFYFDNYAEDPNYWVNGPPLQKLAKSIRLFFTFSLDPHYSFTRNVPAFGSLFTLLLPLAVFLPKRARLIPAALIASGAVLCWGYVYFVDRNLQTFMPVLVCVTGALVVATWRLGTRARIGLVPLIVLQLVWGGDALFYSGRDRIRSSIDLISSGFDGRAQQRFDGYLAANRAIAKVLPRDARVVVHTAHVSLGIDRDVMLDWANYQGLITYAHVRTPRELFDYFRSLGITHLLYEQPMHSFAPSKQEEVVWHALVTGYGVQLGQFGMNRLVALPDQPPPVEPPYRVGCFGLYGYADGVYPIATMHTIEYLQPAEWMRFARPEVAMPVDPNAASTLLENLDAVFVAPPNRPLAHPVAEVLHQRFVNVLQVADRYVLYLRKNLVRHGR